MVLAVGRGAVGAWVFVLALAVLFEVKTRVEEKYLMAAYDAWKAAAQRTVDDAHTRYFIAHIHRLRDEAHAGSPTEELGA